MSEDALYIVVGLLAHFLAVTYLPALSSSFVSFVPFSNDSNVADQDGNTALHLAAISSKTECMRVLLKAGATDSLSLGMFIITDFFPFNLPLVRKSILHGKSSVMLRSSVRMLLNNSDVYLVGDSIKLTSRFHFSDNNRGLKILSGFN